MMATDLNTVRIMLRGLGQGHMFLEALSILFCILKA